MVSATPPQARPNHVDGDSLPWNDTGCDVHPSCLTCPLKRCIYERSQRSQATDGKAVAAKALRAEGKGADEIAALLGVSRKTVYRFLARET